MYAMKRRRLSKVIVPILLLLLTISINNIGIAQEKQDLHQPIRVRIITLRNISAAQAKDYLKKARIIDTVLEIPGTTAISVTGTPEQLVCSANVLKLVDANQIFDVQLLDIPADKIPASSEKIEAKLGAGYSVGPLIEGPAWGAVATKIIVDIHKDKLLIISPAEQTKKITEAVLSSLVSKVQPVKTIEKNQKKAESEISQPNEPENQPIPQLPKEIASVNDVNSASAPPVVFLEEPIVIESNVPQKSAPAKIIPEPNRLKTEDDMLGEFFNELTETAKAEKEAELRNKLQLPNPIVEPNIQKKSDRVEQVEVIKQKPEAEVPEEEKAISKIEKEPQDAEKQKPAEKTAGIAQKQTYEPVEVNIPHGDEVLELNLPEKLEIVALIDLVGKYLNLNYLYDETKITGNVTVKVQGKLKVRELYNLLESVLKFRGFVMSRKDNLVTIVPAAEILEQDPTFADGIKPGDVVVTKIFHLQYISTAAAKKLLTDMKLGSNITEIPETSTLVITEYAFRMQRIEDLLTIVDVPGPPKEFRLRVLKYTIAESLAPKIQALAEQLGTVDVTIGSSAEAQAQTPPGRISRLRQPAQPQPQQTESAKKTSVFIDLDKRTNRILMIGLASEISAVEQIIDSLDVPQQDLRIIREYEIQHVDINKIIEALKELGIITGAIDTGPKSSRTVIERQQPGAAPVAQSPQIQAQTAAGPEGPISLDEPQVVMLESTNSLLVNATPEQHIQISQIISYIDREPLQAAIPYRIYRLENQEPEALAEVLNNLIEKTIKDAEGKIQQTIKYQEEDIAIVPDKNTFSLIVYASKKNQEWIGNLIETLDKRRPQVLIDVSLVEITRDDQFQFDIDVVGNATDFVSKGIAITGDTINTSFPSTSPGKTLLEGGFFAGDTKNVKGFYNAGSIQVLLDLIDKKGYGRVLARPKVLVNDNEEGLISTEDTTYIAQTTTTALPGQTQSDTVQTSVSYSPYTAKIELRITPQISEGNLLRLEIEMQRNDFQDTAGAVGGPPDEKRSSVNTIVTVPDGSTIILGGLTKLNQTKTTNKVPFLGDIPIAGTLFRSNSKVDSGNKLYIFVRANILRPEESKGLKQLEDISRKNRAEFEKAEAEFQQYEQFPGVKEAPLPPKKVLDQ